VIDKARVIENKKKLKGLFNENLVNKLKEKTFKSVERAEKGINEVVVSRIQKIE
jgi:hypothetical protein